MGCREMPMMLHRSKKVAAVRDEILHTLPPSLINDDQWKIAYWHFQASFERGWNVIVEMARGGDVGARTEIKSILSALFTEGIRFEDLPDALYSYVRDQVTGKLSRPRTGRPSARNWPRDFWIYAAMWICEKRGLKPTRTAGKREGAIESGSQLVASILKQSGINEVGVAQIEKIYASSRARRPQITRK